MRISRELHKRIKAASKSVDEDTNVPADKVRLVFFKMRESISGTGTHSYRAVEAIGEFNISEMFRKSGAVKNYVSNFINEQPLPHDVEIEPVFPSWRDR